jgi:VWFA-related protein
MKRRLAALLTCALIAFGQRIPSPPPAAAPDPWVIDAVAFDSDGRPVADLNAGDFEIVEGGQVRKITNFTWFDLRLHAALSPSGPSAQLPALGLVPDEIRRNLVVIVDDLGLPAAGINAVSSALREFVARSMSSGDRMAVLRSSGGTGVLQQLTGDTRILVDAIDGIHYLGGSTSAAAAASAFWGTIDQALVGLAQFPGRKIVVLFSENPCVSGPWDRALGAVAHAAHAAGAAVYAIHPLRDSPGAASGVPCALESLARDTGGSFGGDFTRVLQSEQGYYAIGFQPQDDSVDAAGRWSPATPAALKVRRPGVVVRYRAGYLSHLPAQIEFQVPAEHTVLLSRALASPFAASDIRASLTALFSDYAGQNPAVDMTLNFDSRDLSFIRDLEGTYHAMARVRVAAFSDDGRLTIPQEREFKLTLQPAAYRAAIESGLRFSLQMKLPFPGPWQIRAIVADSVSDRIGSASRFVEIPNLKQGALAISSLVLRGASDAQDGAPADPREEADIRIFKPGSNCTYSYSVFGALIGPDKQSSLETQTRILAGGRLVFERTQKGIVFGEAPVGARRQIKGRLNLESRIAPGDYLLQVTVRDALAPPDKPRTATQFIDFQVRE